ncbi:hypothetical protein [Dactylosporangium sp. NPDC051541]|uniref:hypothetical protein n=1 Tax=Dactylosporangium sp. NPDC051541 TaxID=3363977 RepID=UPI00378CFC31
MTVAVVVTHRCADLDGFRDVVAVGGGSRDRGLVVTHRVGLDGFRDGVAVGGGRVTIVPGISGLLALT